MLEGSGEVQIRNNGNTNINTSSEGKEKKIEVPTPMAAKLKKIGKIFSFDADNIYELYDYDYSNGEAKRLARETRKKEEKKLALQLNQFFIDKGIDLSTVFSFATEGIAGNLFTNLVLRIKSFDTAAEIDRAIINSVIYDSGDLDLKRLISEYKGSPKENAEIDRAIKESSDKNDLRRQFSGEGATRMFNLGTIERELFEFGDTNAVVIGAGPAGEMMIRAMLELGFDRDRITVIDKAGEYGGIWNQKNVAGGSINSPFEFNFEGVTLDPAPGEGTKAKNFLSNIEDPDRRRFYYPMPRVEKGTVTSVEPGDLSHKVTIKTQTGEIFTITAPIVINAIGNGTPLPPSKEDHMTTDTPEEAGIRWQTIITPEKAEKYRGKTLVFIGLGNSTAEMLIQIKELNTEGYNIDYRVLTHYSQEAVSNPMQEVIVDGKKQRVYRDLKKPNLTKYEGDLKDAREAYELALKEGKIISDVSSWHVEKRRERKTENDKNVEVKNITVTTGTGEKISFDYEQLFTLIGYGHDAKQMRQMGLNVTDEYKGTIATDFDGEVQRAEPLKGYRYKSRRGSIYPGYFAIGAVAKTDLNPNAIVMPGIMHRMYDALHTLAYRSREYKEVRRGAKLQEYTGLLP